MTTTKRLYRSRKNSVIGGVCGGLGDYFDVDPVLIRIIWAVSVLVGGVGVVAYVIAWIAIPQDSKVEAGETEEREKGSEHQATGDSPIRDESFLEERRKRRRTGGGLILIGAGVLLLVSNFSPWFGIEKFWPLILIGIGIAVLIGQSRKP
jgi:phage shock protein PspC (stress-responsive transcriptional regulator)